MELFKSLRKNTRKSKSLKPVLSASKMSFRYTKSRLLVFSLAAAKLFVWKDKKQSGMAFAQNCPLCPAQLPREGEERLVEERTLLLAEAGNVYAQFHAAVDYRRKAAGATLEDDRNDLLEKALLWFGRAAENGCPSAEKSIACIYRSMNGGTFENDPHGGVRSLEAAASHGDPIAQDKLGITYYYDLEDKEKAMYWFTLAAARGRPLSRIHLGYGFAFGLGGLDKNLERAKYYLEEIKETDGDVRPKDLGKAQLSLSMVLFELTGKRYEEDAQLLWVPGHSLYFEASSLARKAIENGYDAAEDMLRILEIRQPGCVCCMKTQGEIRSPLCRCS